MTIRRRITQLAFVLLTLIGVFVVQGNAERWCPFGGVEALYTYASEGNMVCSLGVSNFYILAAVLVITLLLRRAFCGYVCPIGALSEWLQRGAGRLGLRRVKVSYGLDRTLALLKYVVLAIIVGVTWYGSELYFRGYDPCYALIGRHGEDITTWAYIISGVIVVASLFITVPFCRWLCPLAAVLNPFSRFGLTRVRRHGDACTGCGACTRACPVDIPVDRLVDVTAARCMSCLKCVEVCPKQGDGALDWGPPRKFGGRWPQGVLITLVLGVIGAAVAASYAFPLPSFVKTRGEEPAKIETVQLEVSGVACRGSATLLTYFIERDDEFAIPGYVRIEAWPGPGAVPVHVTFDPARTDEELIKQAITEPYFDLDGGVWRDSPFAIAGYDPLGLGPINDAAGLEP